MIIKNLHNLSFRKDIKYNHYCFHMGFNTNLSKYYKILVPVWHHRIQHTRIGCNHPSPPTGTHCLISIIQLSYFTLMRYLLAFNLQSSVEIVILTNTKNLDNFIDNFILLNIKKTKST